MLKRTPKSSPSDRRHAQRVDRLYRERLNGGAFVAVADHVRIRRGQNTIEIEFIENEVIVTRTMSHRQASALAHALRLATEPEHEPGGKGPPPDDVHRS